MIEVAQDGEDAPVVVAGRGQAELREQRVDEVVDGLLGDDEPGGDGRVGVPLGHEAQHLALAGGEAVERVRPVDQLCDDLRVHHGAAGGDPADRVDELADLADPVLEQVADRAGPVGEQVPGVEPLHVLRQHQHRQAGHGAAGRDGGAEALVGEGGRQPDVEHRHVRPGRDEPLGQPGLPAAPAHAAPDDFTATEVTFTGNGGVVLHGTVLAPLSAATRRPGLVLLEGAGNRGRSYLRPEAEAYARHGVVTLIYDKRTAGYSMLHRDYSVLADDALGGLRLLRDRPDVDPARLGLWGLSEGAWVAPIAANRSTEVAFLITVGAVGTTPAAQTAWAYGTYLRHAGVRGSLLRTLQTRTVRATIDLGVFAEAGFDPLPVWQQVRQPVLAQWGQLDRDAVPQHSSRLIGAALDRGGNPHHTTRVVAGTNHNLHRTADDGFDRLPTLPADYADFETAWIADPSLAAPSATLADEPATPVFAANRMYSAVALAMLCAFAGYLVAGIVQRIPARRPAPALPAGPVADRPRPRHHRRHGAVPAVPARHRGEDHRPRGPGPPAAVARPAIARPVHRRGDGGARHDLAPPPRPRHRRPDPAGPAHRGRRPVRRLGRPVGPAAPLKRSAGVARRTTGG